MTDYMKDSQYGIFTGPAGCGNSQLVLDLKETGKSKHFDYNFFICPILWWNKTHYT